jgi:hypothetical protein
VEAASTFRGSLESLFYGNILGGFAYRSVQPKVRYTVNLLGKRLIPVPEVFSWDTGIEYTDSVSDLGMFLPRIPNPADFASGS